MDLIYISPNQRAGAVLSWDGNQVATDKHGEIVGDVSLAHLLGPRAQFLGLRILSCQFSGAQSGCAHHDRGRGQQAESLSATGVMVAWAARPARWAAAAPEHPESESPGCSRKVYSVCPGDKGSSCS